MINALFLLVSTAWAGGGYIAPNPSGNPGTAIAGSYSFPSDSTMTISGTGLGCFNADGGTLVVDCANNRTGVSNSSPGFDLDIYGGGDAASRGSCSANACGGNRAESGDQACWVHRDLAFTGANCMMLQLSGGDGYVNAPSGKALNLSNDLNIIISMDNTRTVGINDTSPDATLDITARTGNTYVLDVASANAASLMTVMQSGAVGINETTPEARLEVAQGTGDYALLVSSQNGSTTLLEVNTNGILGPRPGAQTIAAADTIAADACGSLKLITSAGNVTTNTTDSFSTPSALNQGCILHVCNIGSNTITIDANANNRLAGGVDLAMGPNDCAIFASKGASDVWMQISALVAN